MFEPQIIAVVVLVALASAFLVRQSLRTWFGKSKKSCGGCSCGSAKNDVRESSTSTFVPADQLAVRKR